MLGGYLDFTRIILIVIFGEGAKFYNSKLLPCGSKKSDNKVREGPLYKFCLRGATLQCNLPEISAGVAKSKVWFERCNFPT